MGRSGADLGVLCTAGLFNSPPVVGGAAGCCMAAGFSPASSATACVAMCMAAACLCDPALKPANAVSCEAAVALIEWGWSCTASALKAAAPRDVASRKAPFILGGPGGWLDGAALSFVCCSPSVPCLALSLRH